MKFKLIGLTILSSILMVGCEEASTVDTTQEVSGAVLESQQEKLEGLMPETVKDGTVSEDMYLEIFEYVGGYAEYHRNIMELQKKVNDDFTLLDDPSFKDEYLNALDDYEVFIKGLHVSPSTDADFELNNNFSSILFDTSSYIDEVRSYVKTKDTYHTKNASEYNNSIKTSNLALINTIEKYQLFSE